MQVVLKARTEWNQLGHMPDIKFVFQHVTTISTHAWYTQKTYARLRFSTHRLTKTLFALISSTTGIIIMTSNMLG